jgi:hypothetical protein
MFRRSSAPTALPKIVWFGQQGRKKNLFALIAAEICPPLKILHGHRTSTFSLPLPSQLGENDKLRMSEKLRKSATTP